MIIGVGCVGCEVESGEGLVTAGLYSSREAGSARTSREQLWSLRDSLTDVSSQ